jgi:ABC-type multidrug transport system ATPase subunit
MHQSKFCLVIFKKYDKSDTGEMLVGPAIALFMDEISTGLDSSTTFQIVNSLKQATHILGGTAVISLLQPAPETYDLFDDIILLSDEQIVYQGPRESVLEFFESVGFKCPERKGVADFLQEVAPPSELSFSFSQLLFYSYSSLHLIESFAVW